MNADDVGRSRTQVWMDALLQSIPRRLFDYRRGEGPRFLEIPVRPEIEAVYDPAHQGLAPVGFRTVTVDLADMPEVRGGTPEDRARVEALGIDRLTRHLEREVAQAFGVPAELLGVDPAVPGSEETAGFRTVTVDLAIEGADQSAAIPGEAARTVEREIERRLSEVFYGRRVVDGEPNELTRSLAGSNTVTAEEVRAAAQQIYDDLAVSLGVRSAEPSPELREAARLRGVDLDATDSSESVDALRGETGPDGGFVVPPHLGELLARRQLNGLIAPIEPEVREGTFRGIPIRYRPAGDGAGIFGEPDRCYCDFCQGGPRQPWPDPIRAAARNDDRVAAGVAAQWTDHAEPVEAPARPALSWDEFMKQSAELIDKQKRRGE